MNQLEAETLLKEIKQDPSIAEGNVISNMDGTYSVDVDYYPDPILAVTSFQLFKSRNAWLEWKAEKINEEQVRLNERLDKKRVIIDKLRTLSDILPNCADSVERAEKIIQDIDVIIERYK